MRTMHTATILAITCTLLCASACQKDKLTVESTLPPSTHACTTVSLHLNVDSLVHLPPPHITTLNLCDCDSLSISPINIPTDLAFDHWYIDQDGHISTSDQMQLDTLTVSAELLLVLHQIPGGLFIEVPVTVHVGPC